MQIDIEGAYSGESTCLYYALGGGLGHITRAVSLYNTLGMKCSMIVVTNSEVNYTSKNNKISVINVKGVGLHNVIDRVLNLISDNKVRSLFIDSYPSGLYGELIQIADKLEGLELIYVARVLDICDYARKINKFSPVYDKTIIVEELNNDHMATIDDISKLTFRVELAVRRAAPTAAISRMIKEWDASGNKVWLIVHSGSSSEIDELVKHAASLSGSEEVKPDIFLVSSTKYDNELIKRIEAYPADALIARADKVITGYGFNSCQQGEQYKDKHIKMPFKRPFNEQHLRMYRDTGDQKWGSISGSRGLMPIRKVDNV